MVKIYATDLAYSTGHPPKHLSNVFHANICHSNVSLNV